MRLCHKVIPDTRKKVSVLHCSPLGKSFKYDFLTYIQFKTSEWSNTDLNNTLPSGQIPYKRTCTFYTNYDYLDLVLFNVAYIFSHFNHLTIFFSKYTRWFFLLLKKIHSELPWQHTFLNAWIVLTLSSVTTKKYDWSNLANLSEPIFCILES